MKKALLAVLAAVVALAAAEDTWTKVRELKSGTELRIRKKGTAQPLLATMDEANEERIVVVLKNEQVAIPKDQIDQVDARPKGGSRVTKESKVTSEQGNPADRRIGGGTPGPTVSSSTGLSFGEKPAFETIYRRLPATLPTKP